jgi:hypothetical protein
VEDVEFTDHHRSVTYDRLLGGGMLAQTEDQRRGRGQH